MSPDLHHLLPSSVSPDFRNAAGSYLLKPIFYELDDAEHLLSVYSLKDYDHVVGSRTYPSLRRLYIELSDPTEHIFANTYLGGWSHWKKICSSPSVKPYIEEWREELEVKLRSEALYRIKVRASSNQKDSLTADRLLLSGGWKTSEEKSSVGRPTKEKIKTAAEALFKEKTVFDEDYERIMGQVN